jgi:hypothetical protein
MLQIEQQWGVVEGFPIALEKGAAWVSREIHCCVSSEVHQHGASQAMEQDSQ